VLDEIAEDARMFLINALYFKGTWKSPFEVKATRKEAFARADGSSGSVDMMGQTHSFDYAKGDDYAMVDLPYGNGAFSMVVVLPDKGVALDEMIASMTADAWAEALGTMGRAEVDLRLPRFRMEYNKDLVSDMMALGMRDAFSSHQADFSKMAKESLCLNMLKQLTYVSVDEAGTEAAAVTVGGMATTSVPESVSFHVNRPFAFFIKEVSTGAILFIGRVNSL
jgi:serpin B